VDGTVFMMPVARKGRTLASQKTLGREQKATRGLERKGHWEDGLHGRGGTGVFGP